MDREDPALEWSAVIARGEVPPEKAAAVLALKAKQLQQSGRTSVHLRSMVLSSAKRALGSALIASMLLVMIWHRDRAKGNPM
jgi:hypothetical protein